MLIGDKYKIESDSLNVTLYKPVRVKRTGGIRWQPLAYFSSVENALDYLVDLEVMETGLKDFRAVVEKQKGLHRIIKGLKQRSDFVESCTGHRKTEIQGKTWGTNLTSHNTGA